MVDGVDFVEFPELTKYVEQKGILGKSLRSMAYIGPIWPKLAYIGPSWGRDGEKKTRRTFWNGG